MKTRKLYEVREFVGNCYSKQLGCRLRPRVDALRVAKILKKQGREIIITPLLVAA